VCLSDMAASDSEMLTTAQVTASTRSKEAIDADVALEQQM